VAKRENPVRSGPKLLALGGLSLSLLRAHVTHLVQAFSLPWGLQEDGD